MTIDYGQYNNIWTYPIPYSKDKVTTKVVEVLEYDKKGNVTKKTITTTTETIKNDKYTNPYVYPTVTYSTSSLNG